MAVINKKSIADPQDICRLADKGGAANSIEFMMNLPYRSLARMSGGIIDMKKLDKLLDRINK